MPETSCLHIQARESDPVRVVDMTGGSIRIGRAAYCDVRLPDAALADEECRLRRRGDAWELVPVSRKGTVWLDGQRVEAAVMLAIGQTFLVGSHRLTLRASATHSPWTDQPIPVPAVESPGRELATTSFVDRPSQAGDSTTDRWVHAQRETKRWESRWRAAGEKLRATAAETTTPVALVLPAIEVQVKKPRKAPPRRENLLRDAGARRPDIRPPRPAVSPSVTAVLAPSPAGYVPPSAPATSRRPVTSSDWTAVVPPASIRPVPQVTPRSRRDEVPYHSVSIVEPVRPTEDDEVVASPLADRVGETSHAEWVKWVESSEAHQIDSPAEVPPGARPPLDSGEPPSYEAENFEQVLAEATRDVDAMERAPSADLEPLLSLLHSLILADATAAPLDPESIDEKNVPELAPGPIDLDDDEENQRDEPARPRPLLGAARRVQRSAPEEDAEPVWEPVEPDPIIRTEPDRFRDGATRWVSHRPAAVVEPDVAGSEEPAPDDEPADDWSYQTPFVTDTNRIEPDEDLAPSGLASHRGRSGERDRDRDGFRREPSGPKGSRSACEWPTVDDIFAAQGVRPVVELAEARSRRPEPTVVREPDRWRLPLWLGWLPGSTLALGVGAVGMTGAWHWAQDGFHAGLVAQRLATAEPTSKPLPAGVTPSDGSWMTTSAGHLVQWAAYLDRDADNPEQAREARDLLKRAAMISPLNPTVRYALARPQAGEEVGPVLRLSRSLGQSRDVSAMAWAGRALLAAGKRDAALRTFRAALEMAVHADLARLGVPAFVDDPQVRRYALPTEDLIAGVVREMAGSTAWSYKDWAVTLPRGTAAAVVAARVLRESGSPDAPEALDAALAEAGATENGRAPEGIASPKARQAEAIRLAAGAEALTMKQRWSEARDRYLQAVELMPVELIRRAWWINLADLSARLGDDPERQQALEAAKVADLKDEVTRRAVELQRALGMVARRPVGRVAASPSDESAGEARR